MALMGVRLDGDNVEDDGSEDELMWQSNPPTQFHPHPFHRRETSSVIILFALRHSLILTLQVGGLCYFQKPIDTDKP